MADAPLTSRFANALSLMQWARGLRAGAVIASIAAVCAVLHQPLGWACVGGFLSVIVDNGGPYRSRLANVTTLLAGGTLACFAGSLGATNLLLAILVTALFCFAATLARVLSQPLASASIAILSCYFASFGSGHVPFRIVLANVTLFAAGCLWAAALILFLWPVDAFRPARNAVAACYDTLTLLATQLLVEVTPETRREAYALHSKLRGDIETAQQSLAATPARVPSRTVRARNLAVLLQSADLLFARILRIADLTENASTASATGERPELSKWLTDATGAIGPALRERPHDTAASFAAEGSRNIELRRGSRSFEAAFASAPTSEYHTHLIAIERDCLLNLEVSFEAVRAVWSGAEPRSTRTAGLRASLANPLGSTPGAWFQNALDSLQGNLTLGSVMMRHALRLAVVAVADVLLMRRIHVTHGFWLAMTSIIVLQPYTGQTVRRFAERVGGTVAGGILAAFLASALPNEPALMGVVVLFAILAAAVYAVDYGWYCFFLTPTFVLLAMPHLGDWHFALIRMGTTGIGAATAVLGMFLLRRERESLQLPGLLAQAARADAAYLRAVLRFWAGAREPTAPALAERTLLAPARRACGLATTEAEESLDRALLEPSLSLRSSKESADRLKQDSLTFTTYLRRLTQSITTLAAVGANSADRSSAVEHFAARLESVAAALDTRTPPAPQAVDSASLPAATESSLAAQQLLRMERQVSILERAASAIAVA